MKIRNGFVSNSSSASFVVFCNKINTLQKMAILNATEYAKKVLKWTDATHYIDQAWDITDKGSTIEGETTMDNFDMKEFFEAIGLKESEHFTIDGNNY